MALAPGGLSARELAERTPADRNRYVDLLRVAAIVMVVVGHWLAVVILSTDGELQGTSVLAELPWTRGLTWVFQVMPVFFFVGGYANAASWSSHRRRGGDWAAWVFRRASRLLWPTTLFVVAGAVVVVVARTLGADPDLLADAARFATIALWFLAVYLAVAALAPPMLAAHRRWGWRVPAAVVVAVAVVDLLRFGAGLGWVGNLNYALVWGGVHQLGFLWWDGSLVRSEVRLRALGGIALAAVVTMTTIGPYPVSMVTVPGAASQNTAPPSLALLTLAVAQLAGLLLVRGPARRWLSRLRVWTGVVAANGVVMTLFLWHVVAVIVAVPLLHMTGLLPDLTVGSPTWLALRFVWVAALAAILAPIVVLAGSWERPPGALEPAAGRGRSAPAGVLAGLGVAAGCAGLSMLTLGGLADPTQPLGLSVDALAVYAAGLVLLIAAGRAAAWPAAR